MIDVWAERRKRLGNQIGSSSALVVRSPPEAIRNGDVSFQFRQSSDILYLTGFDEPDTTLVIRPGHRQPFVMFVRERDPKREQWDGRRAGIEGAVARFGATVAYPSSELSERLPTLIANIDALHYSVGCDPDFDRRVCQAIADLRRREKRGFRPPASIVDPITTLHEMRLHKDDEEIGLLRRASTITDEGFRETMAHAAPGVQEYELEAILHYTFRKRGGAGPGYGSIVGSGDNATILHYVENNCELAAGDLLLIDAGCEYNGYTADVTRTFPVSGTFTEIQRRCYEVVLHAQIAAIKMIRPGSNIDDIHALCVRKLTQGMVDLGLLQGDVDALIDNDEFKRYYMHGTSHWLGLDVHDVGAYRSGDRARPLEPGMVITVEPGIYIGANDSDAPMELRGLGIRIEDDVLVTATGHDVLTAAVPKSIAEIESACAIASNHSH